MAVRHVPPGIAFGGNRFEGSGETDIAGHQVVGRGRIVGTTPALAGRHTARHHDHGGHPRDPEQTEQARVDGNTGVMAAEPRADPFHRGPQPAVAHAPQHHRRPDPRRVARPLPPARRRHRRRW